MNKGTILNNGPGGYIEASLGSDPVRNMAYVDSSAAVTVNLSHLQCSENQLKQRMDMVRASQNDLAREIARLDILRAQVGGFSISTRAISNSVISPASSSANKISTAVQRLDIEQSRVKSTLDVVELVSELKACVLGVTGSMGAPQDWETAAAYLFRAAKIPPTIVSSIFAENIVPTSEVPDPPGVTLACAAESLMALFLKEFEKAASEGNGGKITRFFKLFPLIGKSDEGLEVYGRYVCQGVASRARGNLNAGSGASQQTERLFFASALTKLFEHIAQIIDGHGGLVERHYGSGRMIKVIERLQLETDVQGGIILDTWSDERNIDRTLTDIRSYAFTFLVQSFLHPQVPRSSTPRVESLAKRGSTHQSRPTEDDAVDMKQIDTLMSEMTLMLGRWSLYSKFITNKCNLSCTGPERAIVPPLLADSSLRRKIAEKLIHPFNIMTGFFLRRSVEKAFQMDEQPLKLFLNHDEPLDTNPPYITSAVDDVMYIVRQTLDRALNTSQRAVVASIIPTISRVLCSDFIGMIQRKMRDESYPKAVVQGVLPAEQIIISFLILINNLDVSIDYTRRIVESRLESPSNEKGTIGSNEYSSKALNNLFPLNYDAAFVCSTVQALKSSFETKAFELIGDGIFVAFKNIIKPRIRPILTDVFRDVDYQLTYEELDQAHVVSEAEGQSNPNIEGVVQGRFRTGWDALMKPVTRILTDRNIDKLLTLAVSYLSEVLEKRIWSYYGRLDNLGGIRLERDIASVATLVVRGGYYRLREAFARCTQICIVMNMEDDEWDGVKPTATNEDGHSDWQLTADERSRARAMTRRTQ